MTFLHDTMGLPLALYPKQCLLGILLDTIDKYTKIFLHETLFSARKIVAKKWMRQTPPKIVEWKLEVNNTLPYKKCVYILTEVAQTNITRYGTAGYKNLIPVCSKTISVWKEYSDTYLSI